MSKREPRRFSVTTTVPFQLPNPTPKFRQAAESSAGASIVFGSDAFFPGEITEPMVKALAEHLAQLDDLGDRTNQINEYLISLIGGLQKAQWVARGTVQLIEDIDKCGLDVTAAEDRLRHLADDK